MEGELRALAKAIGEIPPGADPLEAHPDLRDAVATSAITPEMAAELAAARSREAATRANLETRQAQTAQEREAAIAHQQGVAELNALGATLQASDPQYAAKYAILVPALKPVFAQLPSSQWKAAFAEAYRNLQVPAAAAPPAAALAVPAKPTPQPLRANKQPSGDGQKQPRSMLEAINSGLAAAGS